MIVRLARSKTVLWTLLLLLEHHFEQSNNESKQQQPPQPSVYKPTRKKCEYFAGWSEKKQISSEKEEKCHNEAKTHDNKWLIILLFLWNEKCFRKRKLRARKYHFCWKSKESDESKPCMRARCGAARCTCMCAAGIQLKLLWYVLYALYVCSDFFAVAFTLSALFIIIFIFLFRLSSSFIRCPFADCVLFACACNMYTSTAQHRVMLYHTHLMARKKPRITWIHWRTGNKL